MSEPPVLASVTRWLGPGHEVEPWKGASEQAALWRVRRGAELVAWVKVHRHAGAAAREVEALRAWGPHLPGVFPTCLAFVPDRTLVLSHVPGEPVDRVARADRTLVWRALGAVLAQLHAVDVPDPDPVPLDEALEHRARSLLASLPLAPSLLRSLRDQLGGPWHPPARRPCHRDLRPEHAIWDGPQQGVRLIDLGQARLDDPHVDLVKLEAGAPGVEASDVAAVLDGYRQAGGAVDLAHLERLRLLHAAGTVAWLARRGADCAASVEGLVHRIARAR